MRSQVSVTAWDSMQSSTSTVNSSPPRRATVSEVRTHSSSRWLSASTGPLHDQLARTDDTTKKTLAANATVATGRVLDAALSELDEHAGTAKMLASVEITMAKQGTAPAVKRNRFAAALSRTPDGWKLSALDQLPVGAR